MMNKGSSFKVIFVSSAKQDLKEASAWYKLQLPGLQKRFTSAIKSAVIKMQRNPYAYAIRHNNVRIVHPEIFPFGIHFYIEDDAKQIVITSIVHDYRDTWTAED